MSKQPSELRGALRAGTVLRGYVIEAVLGYGGYGVVYRARHEELGHLVAIKEYLPADLSVRDRGTVFPRSTDWLEVYEDGKRRFLEEAKRIVQFKAEPGVVTCLDFFRANGTAYLVMEYVDGLPLANLLKGREGSGRPLDEEELLSLVNPLLKTLSRLHEAGVLHRDVKPSNILVRRADGQPMLIDFGAAKEGVALHSKSVAPYTEGYAALEQVGEGELGPWTDIYGVGAVMWRIVAGGSPPWTPPNPSRVELRAAAVLTGKPDPLPLAMELGAGRFSKGLLEAIDRCLVIRADERIQSAEDLRRRLVGQNEIRPESVPEPLPEAPPGRSISRVGKVVAATLAPLVVATFAALLFAAVWFGITGHLPWNPVEAPEPTPGSFRVETVPADAVVALLNAGAPYEPGVRLAPGRYEVEVSAPGYATQREFVEHGTADTVRRIELLEHESPTPAQEPKRAPPTPIIRNPKLAVEPTVRVPPDVSVPAVDLNMFGDPFGADGPPSGGPGSDGDVGGEVARTGGAVSQPRLLYKVEPEYSEEARKAKYQGTVMLAVEVWEDGLAHNIRVLRSLGLGLDEKAVEAVKQWKFSPGKKDGKPVKVLVQIQVNFRLK